MADSNVAGMPGENKVAWAVTNVFAPQYVAFLAPVLTGGVADGLTGALWGLGAAAVCVGVPAAVIGIGVRRGRLDSMHVVDRTSRKGPLLSGLVALILGLVVLIAAGAPPVVKATVAVMLACVAVMGAVTIRWKISFHTGVVAGTTVMLAHLLPPAYILPIGAAITALVSWARVRVSHHTPAQTIAGATTGAILAWAVFTLLT